ncbi:calmodulin [Quillaja saponaria]|uniref:Calmodulin n=1 Tax=Quillaja saponaria TaxID=32244 RepID=A0AAD7VLI8_QUISA|nr:calmodulin [Quillaja saponaria]
MCPSGRNQSQHQSSNTGNGKSFFRPAFEILDADNDGKIGRDDLQMFYTGFLRNNSSEITQDDDVIGTMLTVADSNKDGFVEYEEFERILLGNTKKKSLGSGVMEDVFRVMDKDGDGKLSHGDLKSHMEWAGFAASDEDIKAMIRVGGGDEIGGVTFDGLLQILAIDFLA